MCGITGFWDRKGHLGSFAIKNALKKMTDAMVSRGPDAEGFFEDSNIGLGFGHRRLSIVDLSPQGAQPMTSYSGSYTICYNGEVYNAPDLKKQMEGDGIRFEGHSDTRIILEMFDRFGIEKVLPQLNGMFAIALFHHPSQTLYLIRDRIGVKPLYMSVQSDVIVFGSTLHSIRGCPFFKTHINSDVLPVFIKYNCVPEDFCVLKDVQKVTPGCFFKITKTSIEKHQYYSLFEVAQSAASQKIHDPRLLEESMHNTLKDSVKKRMMADVPLGAFLSGGVDSSLVVVLMQSQSDRPVKTFSIGLDDPRYDEAPYAKEIAKHLGTDHTEEYCNLKHLVEIIPSLAHMYDEPFADSSQIPTYLVSEIAKKHATVVLSGDGGDEVFGGYSRYIHGERLFNIFAKIPSMLKGPLSKLLSNVKPSFWNHMLGWLPGTPNLLGEKIWKSSNLLKAKTPQEFYNNCTFVGPDGFVRKRFDRVLPPTPQNLAFLEMMQFQDLLTYLVSDCLVKVDRASMAVSLEVREPMLDYRLIELGFKTPTHQKIQKDQGKIILKKILGTYIPKKLFDRPKMGFGIPIGAFLKNDLLNFRHTLTSGRLIC